MPGGDHALPDIALPGIVPAVGDDLGAYQAQRLTWRPCGTDECATLLAPEDYERPGWHAVTLTVRRSVASGTAAGTVVVNPGGPGATTEGALRSARAIDALSSYTVVGLDPRGSEGSTPVRCVVDAAGEAEARQRELVDLSPDDDAEWSALQASERQLASACAEHSGAWLGFVSTRDSARDLELLRVVLGLPRLDYVGWSAGTLLGAWYAALYPATTGRLVLDGPVSGSGADAQPQGFERAFRRFAAWAAPRGTLGESPDAIVERTRRWLADLDASPASVGGSPLTQTLAAGGVALALYAGDPIYPQLEQALADAWAGDARVVWSAGQAAVEDPDATGKVGQRAWAFQAITCADRAALDLDAARREWAQQSTVAPLFGYALGPDLQCTWWPVHGGDVPQARVATPPLVVATTGDPATPIENAAPLAEAVGGRVFTWDGAGHTASGRGHACVDRVVAAYLQGGVVPEDGASCAG